jgi:hypothetical protein
MPRYAPSLNRFYSMSGRQFLAFSEQSNAPSTRIRSPAGSY